MFELLVYKCTRSYRKTQIYFSADDILKRVLLRDNKIQNVQSLFHGMIKNVTIKPVCDVQNEPRHEISINVVCATSNASDNPAHTRSLIRAFASNLNIH